MRFWAAGAAALALVLGAAPALPAQASPGARGLDSATLTEIRRDLPQIDLPAAAEITRGARSVPAGTRVAGSVATHGGDLEIFGTVNGDAIAIDGNVIVHDGGRVAGDVLAVHGEARITGAVAGAVMRLEGNLAPAAVAAAVSPVAGAWRTMGITLGTLGILLVMGIGVLIFSGSTLDAVVEATEGQLSRSFLVGLAGQLALVPGLVLLCLGLALTILGLLLIPFAIVAYALAAAGAMTLGFLGVAVVIGGGIAQRRKSRPLTARATSLRALMLGVISLFVLWVIAAALVWSPLASAIMRLVALGVTWVAVTVGFGAVMLSRFGSRRAVVGAAPAIPLDEISWQTPTPVSGVAAARRPTPVMTGKSR